MDGMAAGFGAAVAAKAHGGLEAERGLLLLGKRRRDGAGGRWLRWCWKESQLIWAWGGGGRLRWRREEPERNSSGGGGRPDTAARAGAVTSGLTRGRSL